MRITAYVGIVLMVVGVLTSSVGLFLTPTGNDSINSDMTITCSGLTALAIGVLIEGLSVIL